MPCQAGGEETTLAVASIYVFQLAQCVVLYPSDMYGFRPRILRAATENGGQGPQRVNLRDFPSCLELSSKRSRST